MGISKGTIIIHSHESLVLKSNPLKDPYIRDIIVYLPPDYKQSYSNGYIATFGLAGFGGQGRMLLNADPLGENIEDRMNRLISEEKSGPMILVLLDCFTKFGGNQYINSSATGMYEDYIIKEVVPYIDENYNIRARGVWGKSSGGYGSLILGMRHPKVFQAVADHSGDSAFEYCYLPDFPRALDAFRKAGGPKKWLEKFWNKENHHEKEDGPPLNILGMAAHYSSNPASKEMGVDLPFDLKTGEISQKVWNRWLSWDPVRMVEKYHKNLRRLKLLYIDCGIKDEYNLQFGARIVHSKLDKLNINHIYEEFDGGHMNTSYRYDVSLPKIYSALSL